MATTLEQDQTANTGMAPIPLDTQAPSATYPEGSMTAAQPIDEQHLMDVTHNHLDHEHEKAQAAMVGLDPNSPTYLSDMAKLNAHQAQVSQASNLIDIHANKAGYGSAAQQDSNIPAVPLTQNPEAPPQPTGAMAPMPQIPLGKPEMPQYSGRGPAVAPGEQIPPKQAARGEADVLHQRYLDAMAHGDLDAAGRAKIGEEAYKQEARGGMAKFFHALEPSVIKHAGENQGMADINLAAKTGLERAQAAHANAQALIPPKQGTVEERYDDALQAQTRAQASGDPRLVAAADARVKQISAELDEDKNRKIPTDRMNQPIPDVEGTNTALTRRYQVNHPGEALPADLTMKPGAIGADFDRIDKMMQQTENAETNAANHADSVAARQASLDATQAQRQFTNQMATENQQDRRDKAALDYYTKNIEPLDTDMKFADSYLESGTWTGSNDDALMLKYFDMAKPSTGFRLNTAEINRQNQTRSWRGSAEAFALHAKTGAWFSDDQRAQIVTSMHDMYDAKRKSMEKAPIPGHNKENQTLPERSEAGGKNIPTVQNNKYHYNGDKGEIFSNDGKTWYDANGKKVGK